MSVLNAAQRNAVAELLRVSPVADELGRRFGAAGHELHLVGGSVRDALLGRLGDDLDFCTDAPPEQTLAVVQGWADAIWETGREFGTIGIQKDGIRLEITTFRADAYDGVTRNPIVVYGTSLLDDLARRDFTINSMAVSLPGHVFTDPYGGLADLAAKVIRTPAAPSLSFGDDPLRMLRAARFAAKLRFKVDESVVSAMCAMAADLDRITAERIRDEFTKLLCAADPVTGLRLLVDTGLADRFIPEISGLKLEIDEHAQHKDVYEHSLTVMEQAIGRETDGPDLVQVERDPPVREQGAGLRLADVVQQRGQPDLQVTVEAVLRLERDGLVEDGQRVHVDVLVLVVLVDLHPQRGQLGQDHVGQAAVDEQLEAAPRVGPEHELGQLDLDPLGGDPADLRGQRGHRGDHVRGRGDAQLGDEPGRPQHPQRVVGERLERVGRRPQGAGGQVAQPAVRVGELVRGHRDGHRVHGEVAPAQVVDQRVAVRDLRVAADPVVPVGPVGGDLAAHAAHQHADRAELDAGGPRATEPGHQFQHGLRAGVGGEVEVFRGPAEQRVPDRAADEVQLVAGADEDLAEVVGGLGNRYEVRGRGHGIPHGRNGRGHDRPPYRPAGRWRRQAGGRPAVRYEYRPTLTIDGMARPRRTRVRRVDETSAGGLVVDISSGRTVGALIGRKDRRGRMLWSLPKGHIEAGESAEQAAVREVAEETGIDGRIIGRLGTIDFWFMADGRRVHKTVHHFLMRAEGGELSDADVEVSAVAWVPLEQLAETLAYEDERTLVARAPGLLDRV